MRNRIALSALVLLLLQACDTAPATEQDMSTLSPQDQCQVLQDAVADMRARCGYVDTPAYPKWVPCSTVTGIRDSEELQFSCLPALETECVNGDTPQEWGCHQLVF